MLPLEQALSVLGQGAEARDADRRVLDRLLAVQELVGQDLEAVEQALTAQVRLGEAPGTWAASHLVEQGGKRVRPLALMLSAACFGPVPKVARELAVVAELVHSATLLHDDVVDEGMERRGAVTARRRFGNGVSVLAGDLLLVHALDLTSQHAPTLMPGLIGTLRALVDGEIIQLRGRTELDVSPATYERVLRGKTASLFGWATEVGAQVAGASAEHQATMARFGIELGMAFQLVDDVLDYSGEQTGKTLFADLAEGKLTLPLVLAVSKVPELEEPLRRIHAGDRAPVAQVSRMVVESGACEEARLRATRHTEQAVDALADVAPGPARHLLETVARDLARRAA